MMSTDLPRTRDVVIAIDMGTTATKTVAHVASGAEVASASQGYPLEEPHPGNAVQDPELILTAVLTTLRQVVSEVGTDRIAGLSFCSAMHSLLALNSKYEPLTPTVTWADMRAGSQAERLKSSQTGLALHRRTGTPVHPMSPLVKLVWFREQEPELHRVAAYWVAIKDWILLRMCGELVTDHSLGSSSGLMDIHRLKWDPEALRLGGIQEEQLPRLVSTTAILPGLTKEAADATGLSPETPVVVGAGDGPLANLGVGAVRPGVAACSIGTSGALRVTVDRPAVDPRGGVFCYAITEDRWVIGGAINNGGVALDWVRTLLADAEELSTAQMLDIAATVPAGSGGLIMLPYLLSERAPHWDSVAKGAFIGVTRGHRREHFVRAAVEGVSLQLALVLQSMRAAGLDIDEIRATGGALRHSLWQQMLANAFGIPIELPEGQEGSGFGAALLGMQALGLIESIDVAATMLPIRESVRPNASEATIYEKLLPIFDELYDSLLTTNLRLRRLSPSLPLDA